MSTKKIIAIQCDPVEKINIKTDTTFLLALEAQKRNYKIYWYQTKDLDFINSFGTVALHVGGILDLVGPGAD